MNSRIPSANSAFSPYVRPPGLSRNLPQQGEGLGHQITESPDSKGAALIRPASASDNTSSPSSNSTSSGEHTVIQVTNSSASLHSLATTVSANKTQQTKPVAHQALRVLLDQEKVAVAPCIDRARKRIDACDRGIQECEQRLAAINPTLCQRLQNAATNAEYDRVIATVPQASANDAHQTFRLANNYNFLRSLSNDTITTDNALIHSDTPSLNRATYTVQHSQTIQGDITMLDSFANDIYKALQEAKESLTVARTENNPDKKDDYFKAGNASLLACRFLKNSVNAFEQQDQEALTCYDDRAKYASMAVKSYKDAARCEVLEVASNLGRAQVATTNSAVSRVMNTARTAAQHAAYCYQCASESVANYGEEDTPPSVPSALTPDYKEIGDRFNGVYRQLLNAKECYTKGNSAHAELLEQHAVAGFEAAESKRIRTTICDTGMRTEQPGDTVYFFDQVENTHKEAGRLYEQVPHLREQLTMAEQSKNTEAAAALRQQINHLFREASQLRQTAEERIDQLLSEPHRVSDQALLRLGYTQN